MSTKTLNGNVSILSGYPFSSSDFSRESGIPLIRIRDIKNGITEINFSGHYQKEYIVENGDILIGMDGDFNVVRWQGSQALLNQRVCKVSSNSADIHQGFLFWYLIPHLYEIHKSTPQTTVRHLSIKNLYKIPYPKFSYNEQSWISETLDTLDIRMQQTMLLITKLKLVKEGLLHDLLTRGIGVDGQLRPTFQQAPSLYKKSPLGWIPKEWSTDDLDSALSNIDAGRSPSCPDTPARTGEWGVLKVSAVHPDGFRAHENKLVEQTELQDQRYEVKSGDLLITRANTPELVGLPCLVHTDRERLMLSDKTLRLHVKEGYEKAFIFISLTQPYVRSQIQIAATGTSMSMKNISQNSLKRLNMKFPPHSEQVLIAERILDAGRRISEENALLKKMEQQKAGLMNDLLTGRVRVTELLNHQPPVQ
ncbi:restriction endonuclease subunit S [Aeromonas veronii]|uniref:restriction endonuclease subunit S n=1 Tax=Aeromonas veronii TaxID=654 RepID=UPI00191CD7D4|nr:restriction endonuclease subunit S [Aeromonas veronii]MBL0467236.1 restriction endonuclease subunit S [Aeromonas veronii]